MRRFHLAVFGDVEGGEPLQPLNHPVVVTETTDDGRYGEEEGLRPPLDQLEPKRCDECNRCFARHGSCLCLIVFMRTTYIQGTAEQNEKKTTKIIVFIELKHGTQKGKQE